jgi:Zn-dependent protease with chaperone function
VNGLFGWVEQNNTRSIVLLFSFVLLMQPLAAIALFMPLMYVDPAHAPFYHWAGYAARYIPAVTLTAAALFAMQMWWHVRTVRKVVAFDFVDNADEPRLCALVETLAIAAGIPTPYVGVLHSQAMNAFACGITRKSSVVVFTRAIIDEMDDDELASVIAHELVHIRNGDARLIAAANAFMRNMTVLDRFSAWKPRRYRQIASLLFLPVLFPVYLGVALLSQLCLRLGFASRLLIASAREFMADAEAVRLTQDPAAFVSALQRIQGNSALFGLPVEHDAMMIDGMARGRLATHPPITDRIQAIVATTGQMALDARPRRDTRGLYAQCPRGFRGINSFGRAGWVGPDIADLERVAAVGNAPRASVFRAFAQAGDDRLILGLRWDLALAMLATFVVAMAVHRGDIGGTLGRMVHVLDVPGADAAYFLGKARTCNIAEWKAVLGQKPSTDACDYTTPDFADHAKQFGINVMPSGQMRTDTQMAMLSPNDLDGGGFSTGRPHPQPRDDRLPTDLMPSYAMPVHEAWQRLSQGSIAPFLRDRQCGILVHAHVSAVADKSVTWSITSETVEQIRFTATLTADGADATRVTLSIEDFEETFQLSEAADPDKPSYPVAKRPALRPPLRPYFAEAMNAMLESRSFRASRVIDPAFMQDDGPKVTSEICASQQSRLVRGEHFSIHDKRL